MDFTFRFSTRNNMNTIGLLTFAAVLTIAAGQFGFGGVRNPVGGGGSGGGLLSSVSDPLSKAAGLFTKQFGDFQKTFNKVYPSKEEEKKRLGIFAENQQSILDLAKGANLPYTFKINQYADLLTDEFNKLVNGLKLDRSKSHGEKFTPDAAATVPKNVDWREKGAVGPARSQGQCGSCYAFTASGALEGHLAVKNGKLEPLSPQNIMDCTLPKPYENFGCTSGAVDPSFDFIKDNGINLESAYPYEEKAGTECKFKRDASAGTVKGYVLLDEGDEKALEEALATKGPVACGIDAHAKSFQFYGGGIYYEPTCSSSIDRINHAVLAIGFGTEADGQKYWLIKNSYGPTWGENGFAKLARNVTNHCGIATYSLYPEV